MKLCLDFARSYIILGPLARRAELYKPSVSFMSDFQPTAVLEYPVVFKPNASIPTAVFLSPS